MLLKCVTKLLFAFGTFRLKMNHEFNNYDFVSRHLLTVILFIARSCVTGAFQALYVYTPEVYSTEIRAIGLGASCSAARIGAIITPFIGQVCVALISVSV